MRLLPQRRRAATSLVQRSPTAAAGQPSSGQPLLPPAGRWLAFALALSAGCAPPPAAAPKARPPPLVTVGKAAIRDVPVEVQAPVDLRPSLQAEVGSKTLGYLDAVFVDRGDRVRRGQLLALVRPSDLPDQLASAKGTLAQAEASLGLARQNRERAQRLYPSGLISQQEEQSSAAALLQAEAQLSAATANLAATATRLGETRILSPLDGVVSLRRLDPGALVGPAIGPVLTVVRTDLLHVFITANERNARGLAVGQPAHLDFDALPGQTFSGKVVRLAPSFDPLTRTLEAEVELQNRSGTLRPGMYGRGAVVVEVHPGAPTVPEAAVQISNRRRYVFVLQPGDRVQRRSIETGVDHGDWLEVLQGLNGTEEVVIAGADGLDDGAVVRPLRQVDPYSGEGLAKIPAANPASAPAVPPVAAPSAASPPRAP